MNKFKVGYQVEIKNTGFRVSSRGPMEIGDVKIIKNFTQSRTQFNIKFSDGSGGYGHIEDGHGDSLSECLLIQEIN